MKFDWRELPQRKASRILIVKQVDFDDRNQWADQFAWIVDVILRMKKAFKAYLEGFSKGERGRNAIRNRT